ncbi:MAG: diaminopimelate epimerase [Candidatus Oleimicrobiaceae bacterium]
MRLRFVKISATGNDFVLIDNREGHVQLPRHCPWCSWVCQRRIAVGADGVILVNLSKVADFAYVHINSDGSIAEMCGNGSRAVAFFAVAEGIASSPTRFEIGGRIYTARVQGNTVTTEFPPLSAPRLELQVAEEPFLKDGGFIEVGVPHYVLFTEEVNGLDVVQLGRKYRHHTAFAPRGTNVHFVQVVTPHVLRMRTYERGVEDETLACGTGAVAAALIARARRGCRPPVTVHVPGGELTVACNQDGTQLSLTGTVDPVFEGWLDFPR